jgi:hypothetical protein
MSEKPFVIAMMAVDLQHRDAPGVSPPEIERHVVLWPREHFAEGRGVKTGPSLP